MYEEITIDNSIFYIEQHHLDTFKNIARKMEGYGDNLLERSPCCKDGWIIAFNVWILFLPDDDLFFKLEEKSLYFSSIFIIYEALKVDGHFQSLKHRGDASPELFFLTSLAVAQGITKWISLVAEKYNLPIFSKVYPNRSYFETINRTEVDIKLFLAKESKWVKAIVKELRDCSFSHRIKKCSDQAYFLYVERFLNQKAH